MDDIILYDSALLSSPEMDAARAAAKLQAEQRSPGSIRIVAPLCPFVERTVPEGLGLPAGFVQVRSNRLQTLGCVVRTPMPLCSTGQRRRASEVRHGGVSAGRCGLQRGAGGVGGARVRLP